MTQRKALIAGATGMIGQKLVGIAAGSGLYDQLYLLGRRESGLATQGIDDLVVDFDQLADDMVAPGALQVDDVFIALGTTRAAAGSLAAFRRVDHDYVLAVARFAKAAGAKRCAIVSSVGANAAASSSYLQCKGQVEEALMVMDFAELAIMRPSLLTGADRPGRLRLGEHLGELAAPLYRPLLQGNLRRYRPIDHEAVAAAMVHALRRDEDAPRILVYDHLIAAAKSEGWQEN